MTTYVVGSAEGIEEFKRRHPERAAEVVFCRTLSEALWKVDELSNDKIEILPEKRFFMGEEKEDGKSEGRP